jgi:hypothetical protein
MAGWDELSSHTLRGSAFERKPEAPSNSTTAAAILDRVSDSLLGLVGELRSNRSRRAR